MKQHIDPTMFNSLPMDQSEELRTMMVRHGVDWTDVSLIVLSKGKVTYTILDKDYFGMRYLDDDGSAMRHKETYRR